MQIPTADQVTGLSEDLRSRSKLPQHVLKVLDALPEGTHPMTQLSTAVMSLQVGRRLLIVCPFGSAFFLAAFCLAFESLSEFLLVVQPSSNFAAAYTKGIRKTEFWDPIYEDSLDLIAKMPGIAANIYRRTYKGGKQIEADPKLDWAGNLAHQMGINIAVLMGIYCISSLS